MKPASARPIPQGLSPVYGNRTAVGASSVMPQPRNGGIVPPQMPQLRPDAAPYMPAQQKPDAAPYMPTPTGNGGIVPPPVQPQQPKPDGLPYMPTQPVPDGLPYQPVQPSPRPDAAPYFPTPTGTVVAPPSYGGMPSSGGSSVIGQARPDPIGLLRGSGNPGAQMFASFLNPFLSSAGR